jgi:hypothetical protein
MRANHLLAYLQVAVLLMVDDIAEYAMFYWLW